MSKKNANRQARRLAARAATPAQGIFLMHVDKRVDSVVSLNMRVTLVWKRSDGTSVAAAQFSDGIGTGFPELTTFVLRDVLRCCTEDGYERTTRTFKQSADMDDAMHDGPNRLPAAFFPLFHLFQVRCMEVKQDPSLNEPQFVLDVYHGGRPHSVQWFHTKSTQRPDNVIESLPKVLVPTLSGRYAEAPLPQLPPRVKAILAQKMAPAPLRGSLGDPDDLDEIERRQWISRGGHNHA